MFFPIGDTPNPKNYTAWVNWALIAANVAVYLFVSLPLSLQPVDLSDPLLPEYLRFIANANVSVDIQGLVSSLTAYDLFVFAHGYRPAEPSAINLFKSLFLHAGLAHLGGNMLFLWIFGDNVEHRLGRALYLLVYLFTGVCATLAFSVFAGDSEAPLVGASGAISGVLGLYFLMFKKNKVKVFVFLFPFIVDVWLIPVRWVLGFFIIVDNLFPFIIAAESSVAYGAHLGGFIAGLGVAWLGERMEWRIRGSGGRSSKQRVYSTSVEPEAAADPLAQMAAAIQNDDRKRAVAAIELMDARQLAAVTPKQCALIADWLKQYGMVDTASRLLKKCVASHPSSGDLAKVFLELGIINLERGQPTAAYQHLLSVFDFSPDDETAARARSALDEINIYRKKPRA